jgi:hypothetical protein
MQRTLGVGLEAVGVALEAERSASAGTEMRLRHGCWHFHVLLCSGPFLVERPSMPPIDVAAEFDAQREPLRRLASARLPQRDAGRLQHVDAARERRYVSLKRL